VISLQDEPTPDGRTPREIAEQLAVAVET
jgi:hypothetical protein